MSLSLKDVLKLRKLLRTNRLPRRAKVFILVLLLGAAAAFEFSTETGIRFAKRFWEGTSASDELGKPSSDHIARSRSRLQSMPDSGPVASADREANSSFHQSVTAEGAKRVSTQANGGDRFGNNEGVIFNRSDPTIHGGVHVNTKVVQDAFEVIKIELRNMGYRLEAKESKIDGLVLLYVNPPATFSDRSKKLAALIDDNDPPYARALKAIVEGDLKKAERLLIEESEQLDLDRQRNFSTRGHVRFQMQDYRTAARLLRKALDSNQADVNATWRLAVCLALSGNAKDSLRFFDKAAILLDGEQDNQLRRAFVISDRATARLQLAQLQKALQDYDLAQSLIGTESLGDPTVVDRLGTMLINRSKASAALGQLGDAKNSIEQAIVLLNTPRAKTTPSLQRSLGYAYLSLAQVELVHGAPDVALSRCDEAIELLSQQATCVDHATALRYRAAAHTARRDFLAADHSLSQAMDVCKTFPTNSTPADFEHASVLVATGGVKVCLMLPAVAIEKFDKAVEIFDKLISTQGDDFALFRALAIQQRALARLANQQPKVAAADIRVTQEIFERLHRSYPDFVGPAIQLNNTAIEMINQATN